VTHTDDAPASRTAGGRLAARPISRVGVVGAGRMGSGVAEVCASAHVDVLVWEPDRRRSTTGRERLLSSFDRGVSSGTLTSRERDVAASRIRFTSDLAALADRELVVEAVAEDRDVKTDLFRRIDGIVADPAAVLASTTASVPVTELAAATAHPERVLGMHFFDPVPVLPLVELVAGPETGEHALASAELFAEGVLGKQVVRCADRPGYVVNALLVPYLLSAVRMVESGLATPEEVDRAMVLGAGHSTGPLELADHVGLDTVASIADAMYAASGEELHRPPGLLRAMVAAGETGRRAGRGFYGYDDGAPTGTARDLR